VSLSYMPDVFGFAPMFVFAGVEGWCIREEFRTPLVSAEGRL